VKQKISLNKDQLALIVRKTTLYQQALFSLIFLVVIGMIALAAGIFSNVCFLLVSRGVKFV